MKRRTFLGACASSLLYGCPQPARQASGRLLGPDMALGHRLRDGHFPPPASHEQTPVVIVGGGVAGLSAAWRLQKAGFNDFQLLELEDNPGGNARWGENTVSRYPWGAHYLPLPGPEAVWVRELLSDLGVLIGDPHATSPEYDERYLCHAPHERLFIHGQWQDGLLPQFGISQKAQQQYRQFDLLMAQFKQLRGHDGKRAFAIPSALSSRDPAITRLDQLSMHDWLLQQGLTAKALHWYVNYACRDDYGCDYRQTSAWAGIHYFAARNGQASNAASDSVLTWPEGNGWIVQQLQQRLRQHIRCGQMAFALEATQSQLQLDVWDKSAGCSKRIHCQQLIWAAPLQVLPKVWPALPGDWRNAIGQLQYAPWLVANLTLDGLPEDNGHSPLAWDNVLYDSPGLGYVVATHQQLRQHESATVLTYYQALSHTSPAQARRQLLQTSLQQWQQDILQTLANAHPRLQQQLRQMDIWRWGHAMTRPLPGLLHSAALAGLRRAEGAIHLAHSDLSGFSLFEEAQYWGVSAAEQLIATLNSSPIAAQAKQG
ncbi:MAG: hypothetical protein QG667_1483 [Pseudomonadota bacterium]|nr:hypothetical protein [Pseudomonadota bacterium]